MKYRFPFIIYKALHNYYKTQLTIPSLQMYNVTQENICPPYPDNEYIYISVKCHDREEYTTPESTERKRLVRAFVNELWK